MLIFAQQVLFTVQLHQQHQNEYVKYFQPRKYHDTGLNYKEESIGVKEMLPTESLDPQTVTLTIAPGKKGYSLTVDYNTPSGNKPGKNGNRVYLWQNKDTIPWGKKPSNSYSISQGDNDVSGSFEFTGLALGDEDYVLGYAMGDELSSGQTYGNVCARASLQKGFLKDPTKITYFTTAITNIEVHSKSFSVYYQTLEGLAPANNGAWMAVWAGEISDPYESQLYSKAVPFGDNTGMVAFNNFPLVLGETYTVALMMSGWSEDKTLLCQKRIAALSTFQVPTNLRIIEKK